MLLPGVPVPRFGPPRLKPTSGRARWNRRHPYYRYVLYGVFFTEGGGTPYVLMGPASRQITMPQFSSSAFSWAKTGAGDVARFVGSGTDAIKTANQSIFSGLAQVTALARFSVNTALVGGTSDVARKDGEYTPFQLHGTGTQVHMTTWTSVTGFASNGGFTLTNGVVYDCFSTYDGATGTVGVWGQTPLTYAATGTISSNAGTPFVMGNNEGGVEPFAGDIHFVLFLNRAFPQAQLAWARDNPYSILEFPIDYLQPFFNSESSAINGTVDATLGTLTAAAAGTVLVQGTTSETLGALTASATGGVAVGGTTSETLGVLTATSTGTVDVSGTLSETLGALTASTTATVDVSGSVGATLGALTASATGTVEVSGATSETLGALTIAATGAVGASATTDETLGTLTSSVTGTVAVGGVASETLGTLTAAAAGTVDVSGTTSETLGALTSAATGTVEIAGNLSETLDALTLVATADAGVVDGSVDAILGALTASATGTVEVSATTSETLGALTLIATGEVLGDISGSVDATLGALTLDATAHAIPTDVSAAVDVGLGALRGATTWWGARYVPTDGTGPDDRTTLRVGSRWGNAPVFGPATVNVARDLTFDFSEWLAPTGDVLVSTSWECADDVLSLVDDDAAADRIATPWFMPTVTTATFATPVAGVLYDVSITVRTRSGQTYTAVGRISS